MLDVMGTAGTVFGVVGTVFALIGAAGVVAFVRALLRRHRALRFGETARAYCVDTFVTHDSDGPSRRRAILSFTTPDGREHRVTSPAAGTVVTGDQVPVRYLPDRPQHAVVDTPAGPAAWAGAVFVLLVLTVFTAFGALFAVSGFVGASMLP